ncbi:MAG: SDR family NAD(P)-dependent oxidoreductase [Deltaproteobacteria bacterium]|nr:SDR family NAD(P)-dependent oxidoreductase [Deltaproteobacteria bacterium]
MKLNFKGRKVLITGAAMGIGRGLSQCFAEDGAHLILADLPTQKDNLDAWTRELEITYGIKTWTYGVDLTDPDGPERLHRFVTEKVGDIYCLVNNAGICWYGKFHEMPVTDRLERMILLNCTAYAKMIRLFLPGMIEKDEGAILSLSSMAAFQPVPTMTVYAATKAFTQSLCEGVRYELPGKSRIVISTLNPNLTNTALIEDSGMPEDYIPFAISFKSVDEVVRSGYRAFKKGKMFHIPGWQNRLIQSITSRLLPKKGVDIIARIIFRRWSDVLPGRK